MTVTPPWSLAAQDRHGCVFTHVLICTK